MGRFPSLLVLESDLYQRELFPRSLWRKTTSNPKPLWSEAGRAPHGEVGQQAPVPSKAVQGKHEERKEHP